MRASGGDDFVDTPVTLLPTPMIGSCNNFVYDITCLCYIPTCIKRKLNSVENTF